MLGSGPLSGHNLTRALACAMAVFGAAALAGAAGAQPPYRDPFLQPFSSGSLWNTSIGARAVWSSARDPDTIDLRHPGAYVNAGEWSMPYFLGRESDPLRIFHNADTILPTPDQALHTPPNTHPASPARAGGDHHIILFDPAKRTMFNFFGCNKSSGGFDCALAGRIDTCGDGFGEYGWGIGVMRAWEIRAGEIRHMLRYSLPPALTKSGSSWTAGLAWPAVREDYDGPRDYHGNVLFGSTIGIPANVDLDNLGLTRGGMILAKALQDYGAIQRDTGGERGIIFYAEEAAEGMPELGEMRADIEKLRPHLAILRNQSPSTPNGGGGRRQPPAPPIDPAVCPD